MVPQQFRATLLATLAFGALTLIGCGTVQEGTMEEDWTITPPVSVTARLEYRIDSLMNENRRLSQQLDALQTENLNLTARNMELDAKIAESAATPRAAWLVPSSPSPKKAAVSPGYEGALARFRSSDFKGAIDQFTGLLDSGISDNLADNCHYWIGESYFAMKKYKDAVQHFQTVTGMPGSDKADDAHFMIGNSYASLGNKTAAKEAFQKLVSDYPTSPLAKRARTKMDNL